MFQNIFKKKEPDMNQTIFFNKDYCCGSNDDQNCCSSSTAESSIEDAIREKAYLLWEEAGKPLSDGKEFWLEAERLVSES